LFPIDRNYNVDDTLEQLKTINKKMFLHFLNSSTLSFYLDLNICEEITRKSDSYSFCVITPLDNFKNDARTELITAAAILFPNNFIQGSNVRYPLLSSTAYGYIR